MSAAKARPAAPLKTVDAATRTRRLVIRGVLLALYLGLMVLMIFTGRRHTILIDNKDTTDGSYEAINGMEVSIDRQEPSEYWPGDRDKAIVQGQRHTIKVSVFDDGTEVAKSFTVPLWTDIVIISVPKMLKGIEPWVEPFTMAQQIEEAQSQPALEGMSYQSDGPAAPAAGEPGAPQPPSP
ncbi:MAG: hypothetical protein N2067_08725 [Spirochaetaceae bacterium]|nr:hypothetical protein [Spirochaetaceae bacterium]